MMEFFEDLGFNVLTVDEKGVHRVGNRWTHAVCKPCYEYLKPGREPVEPQNMAIPPCCYCGSPGFTFYRGDPSKVPCNGEGDAHPKEG